MVAVGACLVMHPGCCAGVIFHGAGLGLRQESVLSWVHLRIHDTDVNTAKCRIRLSIF